MTEGITNPASRPYAEAALIYFSKGWTDVFPVGTANDPYAKSPVPTGVTGYDGAPVGFQRIKATVDAPAGRRNLGLRMPRHIVTLDVDGYGEKAGGRTLQALEREFGELPPTYRNTARGWDGGSGHRVYRLPAGMVARPGAEELIAARGPGIEVLHRGRRYAVAWPSLNMDAGGAKYTWYSPDGEPMDIPPAVVDVPLLLSGWLELLAVPADSAEAGQRGSTSRRPGERKNGEGRPIRRETAERRTAEQLDRVRAMVDGNVNTTLGGAGIWMGRMVACGLTTVDDAIASLTVATAENGVHSDAWNAANKKRWTLDSRIRDAISQGMNEPPFVVVESHGPLDADDDPDDPDPLAELPAPGQPYLVARELLGQMAQTDGELHRSWWRGDFYGWTGAHWDPEELPVVERWLYRQTGDAAYLHPVKTKEGTEFERRPWAPTKKKIGDLVHALGVGTLQRVADEDKVIACVNGVVNVRSRELLAHRPSRFNLFSLPFDFDPDAGAPTWHRFLDDVLPGDEQAKDFLAEWFGYVLSGRTDQQKMAALIGQRRSGKGTIARVLGAMVGRDNVAGLDLNLLPGTFGMEGLVGKALAVSGDVRWQSRNIADAVPILLGVIGEDVVSVHRKNRSNWEGHLGVRFLLMSNETPTFSDRSGALSGRMIFVKFDQSFYGREDVSLTDKLMGELPGILNWALDGLARLDGRGRFTEPESGLAEKESTRRLSDPIGAFLDDWCEIGADQSITLDHLYLKYQNWCESEGRTRDSTTKEVFSRDLRAKVAGLRIERIRVEGRRVRMLYGIGCSVV